MPLARFTLTTRPFDNGNPGQFVILDCHTQSVVKTCNTQDEDAAWVEIRRFNELYNSLPKAMKITVQPDENDLAFKSQLKEVFEHDTNWVKEHIGVHELNTKAYISWLEYQLYLTQKSLIGSK